MAEVEQSQEIVHVCLLCQHEPGPWINQERDDGGAPIGAVCECTCHDGGEDEEQAEERVYTRYEMETIARIAATAGMRLATERIFPGARLSEEQEAVLFSMMEQSSDLDDIVTKGLEWVEQAARHESEP